MSGSLPGPKNRGDRVVDPEALYVVFDRVRRARRLTWRAVSRQARVSPSLWTRLGRGKLPDLESFARISLWCGFDANRLLGLEDLGVELEEALEVIDVEQAR